MRIWTEPGLSGLFPEDSPLRLVPRGQIKDAFLREAMNGDIAVMGLDAGCLGFLSALKDRGVTGPVIFISQGSDMRQEDIAPYNAIVLDEGRLGKEQLRAFVNFIAGVARGGAAMGYEDGPDRGFPRGRTPVERQAEEPLDVKKVLSYSLARGIPVVVAFQIMKDRDPFTARGICEVKDIRENALVLHRFRPPALLKELRFEPTADVHSVGNTGGARRDQLRLHHQMFSVFTYEGDTYEALLTIIEADNSELHASIPERLVRERRRHVRVEPDPEEPVEIYMHVGGEPTGHLNVTDISQQGAGFLSDRDLRVGSGHNFTIVLPEPKALVQSYGVVRFKKEFGDVFRYGVELQVHPWDERLLARYIMKRESEILNLLKKR
jgi:hypothetical protein